MFNCADLHRTLVRRWGFDDVRLSLGCKGFVKSQEAGGKGVIEGCSYLCYDLLRAREGGHSSLSGEAGPSAVLTKVMSPNPGCG